MYDVLRGELFVTIFIKVYLGFENRVLVFRADKRQIYCRSGSCDQVFWFMSFQATEFRRSRMCYFI